MNIFIAGGTGFLGYHAIQECLVRGWQVTALGLPPAPPATLYPAGVRVVIQNLEETSDAGLRVLLRGHDALVFAAGLDDRFTPKKPAYPKFYKANVESLTRLLTLAKDAGVGRAVVLGSYFAHFNRLWPEFKLAERHPYIRSRVEQELATASILGLDGMVLELPYIFGTLPIPGWKPLWTPLVRYLRSGRTVYYMTGGTACISARVVGRAIAAAIENGEAGGCYPIGQENLTWSQMLTRLARADGRKIRVVTLPSRMVKVGLAGLWLAHEVEGKESGLNPLHFGALQTSETYLDPETSLRALGYKLDDLDEAFGETVAACR